MKTTVPDTLFRSAKARAAQEGPSLKIFFEHVEIALDTSALSDFAAGNEALGWVLMPFRSLALPITVLV